MKAYPIQNAALNEEHHGMDLRDYFAAKAMQLYVGNGNTNKEVIAKVSYEIADAMMEVRNDSI